jgi:hypothetical protein
MTKLKENLENANITKNITYNGVSTSVKINISNIKKNQIAYIYFPKSVANNLSNIKFINLSNVIIKDKDPIVGWRNGNIEYDIIDGDYSDVGELLLFEVPTIYNSNKLIFNVRKKVCYANLGEVFLFRMENKNGGAINNTMETSSYNWKGDDYNVCVSHLNESYNLENKTINIIDLNNGFKIFKNISSSLNYDLKISENAPVNYKNEYSCMGSINNDFTKFGDCDAFNLSRIWVYLGKEDITYNPRVEINKPFLKYSSSNTSFKLKKINNGTPFNVNFTFDGNLVSLNQSDFTNNLSNEIFSHTCANNPQSCLIDYEIKFTETAFSNNLKDQLFIPNLNSQCQSDCTILPTPGLYVKSCQGLNSCNFYSPEVANSCDFKVKGSYVSFSNTKEIQCPNGPIRPKLFTEELVTLEHNSTIFKTKRIPLVLNGERINMILAIYK